MVTTAAPSVPQLLAGFCLAIPFVCMVFWGAFLGWEAALLFFVVLLVVAAWLLWDYLTRVRLDVDRKGVAVQRIATFGNGRVKRLAAGQVEKVEVRGAQGFNRLHLAIVRDHETLCFTRGHPSEALEWSRGAVLAHVAA